MIDIPLTLRLSARPLRPAEAWLVAGGDPAAWVAQLTKGFADAEMDLFILPASRTDRAPSGLLAVAPANFRCVAPQAAVPFGKIGNLYLPVDAQLWPALTDQELASLLHFDINVLHPAIGLIGFARSDAFRLPQLLAPPPRRSVNWTLARPGIAPPAKLVAVLPLELPTSQDILDEGRETQTDHTVRLHGLAHPTNEFHREFSPFQRRVTTITVDTLIGMPEELVVS